MSARQLNALRGFSVSSLSAAKKEAIVILEGIVRENEQVDVYTYHLGEAYRRKGDSENAIAYLNKAVELAGENSDIAEKAKQSLQQIQ